MVDGKPGEETGGLSGMYLVDLPSEKFYNDMKKDYPDLSKYSQQCDSKSVYNNKNEAKLICEKILRYLDTYAVWIDKNSGYDVCILLNYWIYDTLAHIFGVENTSNNINTTYSSLQYMWTYPTPELAKTNYYKKCVPNFNIFKYIDWDKRRELYEYFVDYTTLYETATNYPITCRHYYIKIEEKKPLYKYFEEKCSSEEYDCPEFYKNYSHYNPDSVLPNLPCHKDFVAATEARVTHHPSGQQIEPGAHGIGPGSQGSEDDSHGTELTPETSELGTKVGHSILGIAPVMLTATALYRYTPIGAWIRKIGGTKPNSISEIEGYSSYSQESGDIFSDSRENYISYQPM
ncbi:PIR protein [Plasmodium ovale]|uniref:PIR Superfamily Protein n=2 Tax=Plasmodium ovale TaxID=36330 RepID=A0A1A8WJ51_PLAOA|nr:PIR Superfamily Protein [Plasmodium ovale curtisi]SBS99640.1 PIR Superfamily Protein [Plasmodium ovale curtisi]SBT84142.1 PIR protein [Plasmodium ovale]